MVFGQAGPQAMSLTEREGPEAASVPEYAKQAGPTGLEVRSRG